MSRGIAGGAPGAARDEWCSANQCSQSKPALGDARLSASRSPIRHHCPWTTIICVHKRLAARLLQFTLETSRSNVIHSWEHGRIRIGEQWLTGHIIVSADTILSDWPVGDAKSLTIEHLEPAIALAPKIILLGTGIRNLMPDIDLMAKLADRAIGLEVMDTAAACRTFNVLIHEQREVVAALLNHPTESAAHG